MDLTFAVVGPGNVGCMLAHSLETAGYEISAVLGRYDSVAGIPERTTAVAICTPDRVIPDIAAALASARSTWRNIVVFHVSGALTSEVLSPLASLGAYTLSFHPLSSYPPGSSDRDLAGTTVAIEGHPDAVAAMTDVAHRMGAMPIVLTASQKAAYHLAASMASNFLVTLSGSVQAILKAAALDPHVMDGLVTDTLSNLAQGEAAGSLTGPIARGDVETIRLHLDTLAELAPRTIPLYLALANSTADMALDSGQIDEEQHRSLCSILERFSG